MVHKDTFWGRNAWSCLAKAALISEIKHALGYGLEGRGEPGARNLSSQTKMRFGQDGEGYGEGVTKGVEAVLELTKDVVCCRGQGRGCRQFEEKPHPGYTHTSPSPLKHLFTGRVDSCRDPCDDQGADAQSIIKRRSTHTQVLFALNTSFTLEFDVSGISMSVMQRPSRVNVRVEFQSHSGEGALKTSLQSSSCLGAVYYKKLRKLTTISAYIRQKATSKYINLTRLERASQKQPSDTHEITYDRVEQCREHSKMTARVHLERKHIGQQLSQIQGDLKDVLVLKNDYNIHTATVSPSCIRHFELRNLDNGLVAVLNTALLVRALAVFSGRYPVAGGRKTIAVLQLRPGDEIEFGMTAIAVARHSRGSASQLAGYASNHLTDATSLTMPTARSRSTRRQHTLRTISSMAISIFTKYTCPYRSLVESRVFRGLSWQQARLDSPLNIRDINVRVLVAVINKQETICSENEIKTYRDPLVDNMHLFLRLQHPADDLYLVQGDAPAHHSRIVTESPELNPTENIWDAIERDIRAMDPATTDILALWEAVERSWTSMNVSGLFPVPYEGEEGRREALAAVAALLPSINGSCGARVGGGRTRSSVMRRVTKTIEAENQGSRRPRGDVVRPSAGVDPGRGAAEAWTPQYLDSLAVVEEKKGRGACVPLIYLYVPLVPSSCHLVYQTYSAPADGVSMPRRMSYVNKFPQVWDYWVKVGRTELDVQEVSDSVAPTSARTGIWCTRCLHASVTTRTAATDSSSQVPAGAMVSETSGLPEGTNDMTSSSLTNLTSACSTTMVAVSGQVLCYAPSYQPSTLSYGVGCNRIPVSLVPSPHRWYTDQQPLRRGSVGTCCPLFQDQPEALYRQANARLHVTHIVTTHSSYMPTMTTTGLPQDTTPVVTTENFGQASKQHDEDASDHIQSLFQSMPRCVEATITLNSEKKLIVENGVYREDHSVIQLLKNTTVVILSLVPSEICDAIHSGTITITAFTVDVIAYMYFIYIYLHVETSVAIGSRRAKRPCLVSSLFVYRKLHLPIIACVPVPLHSMVTPGANSGHTVTAEQVIDRSKRFHVVETCMSKKGDPPQPSPPQADPLVAPSLSRRGNFFGGGGWFTALAWLASQPLIFSQLEKSMSLEDTQEYSVNWGPRRNAAFREISGRRVRREKSEKRMDDDGRLRGDGGRDVCGVNGLEGVISDEGYCAPTKVQSISRQSQCSRVVQAPSHTVGFTHRFHKLSSIHATNTLPAVVPQSPVVCLRLPPRLSPNTRDASRRAEAPASLIRTFLRRRQTRRNIQKGRGTMTNVRCQAARQPEGPVHYLQVSQKGRQVATLREGRDGVGPPPIVPGSSA
ncbi:hypothetical protein PR048_000831 [Dryococelus australis]|uniref:Uncharacterized protein n=1 Tax=Dryococelus australis TaxID=614101 RepID=A0ABQ9IFQ2_9NEOP|nr:hypothetical protein PR048_000831 [Dryococelus australis]